MSERLPKGWCVAKVRDVGTVQLGRQRSPDVHRGANMRPYLRVANVYEDQIDLSDVMEMHFEPREVERYELKTGDILLNEGQSRELVGRPAMYRGELPGACFTNSLVRFQSSEIVDNRFALQLFRHWLRNGSFQAIAQITTNIAHLGAGRFAEMDFPLPPLKEQRRIVTKLEALQARTRRAREALDAVLSLLKKLRESILAAAFRGDLTKDWRAKHKDVEPASELLKRVRIQRRTKWEEAELAKMRAAGKAPTDDKWKAKYEEPEPVDVIGLPELPNGWCWASLESLTDCERSIPYGIVQTGDPDPDGVPTVRCGDIKSFRINLDGLKRVNRNIADEFSRTRLEGGEVLIAIRGTVGATAVATDEMAGMNISREVAMIPLLRGVMPQYLMFCLAGPEAEARLMKHVKGVAQAGINLSDLRALPVPIAPSAEQAAVTAKLEQHLELCSSIAASHGTAMANTDVLDRAVLATAFRGDLVPQHPNDEPAEAMLARLRAGNGAPLNGTAAAKSKGRVPRLARRAPAEET